MGKPCPICGRGMFKYKDLIKHMVKHHSPQDHPLIQHIVKTRVTGAEIRRRTKKYQEKKKRIG